MSGRYQVLPPLTASELAELRRDIEANGVQVPIIVTGDGEIVDGHHRAEIARKLDIPCPREVKAGHTEAEYRDMALRLNLHRRNLPKAQRDELIRLLRAEGMTQEKIAETADVSQPRVSQVLNINTNNESPVAEPPQTIVNSRGQKRPATYKKPDQPAVAGDQPSPPPREPRVNKRHAATRAEEDAIAESVRNNGTGMVIASRRTPRVVAATDRLMAVLNQAAIAVGRAMNDADLDVEFMRAQDELNPDAQLDTVRRDLRRRIDDLGRKLRELREAAEASSAPEESAARQ